MNDYLSCVHNSGETTLKFDNNMIGHAGIAAGAQGCDPDDESPQHSLSLWNGALKGQRATMPLLSLSYS